MDIVVFFGILLFIKFVGDSFNIPTISGFVRVCMWIIVTSLGHFNRGNLHAECRYTIYIYMRARFIVRIICVCVHTHAHHIESFEYTYTYIIYTLTMKNMGIILIKIKEKKPLILQTRRLLLACESR